MAGVMSETDERISPRSTLEIADTRAQAMPVAPVLNQISHQPIGEDAHR
jgi:hypothetical protein